MKDGSNISEEINVADAHPSGRKPFKRDQYIEKFRSLTAGLITTKESERFISTVQKLKKLKELSGLNIKVIQNSTKRKLKKLRIF